MRQTRSALGLHLNFIQAMKEISLHSSTILNGAKLGGAGGSGAPADFLVSVLKSREFGCFVVS